MEQEITNEVLPGVTPEAAAGLIAVQPVQPTAQTTEGAQPEVEGLGTLEHQESVSYERFKEVNEAGKASNLQVETLQQQLATSQQMNQLYQVNSVQPQNQPPTRIEALKEKLSKLGADEQMNADEGVEMLSIVSEMEQQGIAAQQESSANMFLAMNPDYTKMVGENVPGMGFQYRPDYQEMLKTNPATKQHIDSLVYSPLDQAKAMLTAVTLYQKNKVTQQIQAPQIPGVPNSAPQSLGAIPIGGGGQKLVSYDDMSDEAFLAHAEGIRTI